MDKLFKKLDQIEDILLAVMIGTMVIVIFVATAFRFLKITTFSWSEELARYLMIGIVFIGISKGSRTNSHFTVSNFVSMLPTGLQRVMFFIRSGIIIAFCSLMTYQTFTYIQRVMQMNQKTPALHLPMWAVYMVMLVGFSGVIIRNLQWMFLPKTLHLDEEDPDIGEV